DSPAGCRSIQSECTGGRNTPKKEKLPPRSTKLFRATWRLRTPSPAALGALATGSGREAPRCSGKPGRLREALAWGSRGEWGARRPYHVPPNLPAQCKQERKFCQAKTEG